MSIRFLSHNTSLNLHIIEKNNKILVYFLPIWPTTHGNSQHSHSLNSRNLRNYNHNMWNEGPKSILLILDSLTLTLFPCSVTLRRLSTCYTQHLWPHTNWNLPNFNFSLVLSLKKKSSDIHLPRQDTILNQEIPIGLKYLIASKRVYVDNNTPIRRILLDLCSFSRSSVA